MIIKITKESLIPWVVAGLIALGLSATADAEDFYAGKTLRFIVGNAPGGGYDTYTRAVARHTGRFIPGNPTAVVENMEGAGSLLAANYLYNKAEADGLTIYLNRTPVLQPALDYYTALLPYAQT